MNNCIFTKLPQFLFQDNTFASVSNGAKLLYSHLLNRINLSKKNKELYSDQFGVFVIFARENLAKLLSCSRQTISRYMKELTNVGLIFDRRIGLNKANHIYIQDIETINKPQKEIIEKPKKKKKEPKNPIDSGCYILEHQEVTKYNANKTDLNKTNKDLSSSKKEEKKMKEQIIKHIDLDSLPDKKKATDIIDVLASVKQLSLNKTFKINGKIIKLAQLLPLLDNITTKTVKELCERFTLTRRIFNPQAFLMATLYNLYITQNNNGIEQNKPIKNELTFDGMKCYKPDELTHLIHFF